MEIEFRIDFYSKKHLNTALKSIFEWKFNRIFFASIQTAFKSIVEWKSIRISFSIEWLSIAARTSLIISLLESKTREYG